MNNTVLELDKKRYRGGGGYLIFNYGIEEHSTIKIL